MDQPHRRFGLDLAGIGKGVHQELFAQGEPLEEVAKGDEVAATEAPL